MSQPPDASDPYLPRPDGQEPSSQQPYGQPSYGQQPYPQQGDWTGGHPDLTGGPSQDAVRADKPASVVRLVRTMWSGAVLAVLTGAYGLLSVDDAVSEALPTLERDMAETGVDVASVAGIAGWVVVATLVVSTVVVVALWSLFAWLFGRGQARVVGTVLGAVNGLGSVWGLFQSLDLVELVLNLLSLAVVVAAMVLLWLPATSAWFRAVKAADRSTPWA